MLHFTASDNGKSAALQEGETFEISLPENPATGFQWKITAAGEPASKLIDEDFHPGDHVGGQGVHAWRFRAVRQGESVIKMDLRRSWEAPAEPTQSFTLRVLVRS